MPVGFAVPKVLLDKKPPHGEPCTRCGLCCVASLCPLAKRVFGDRPGPCPALSYDETPGSVCGLVATPEKFAWAVVLRHGREAAGAAARYLIGSATGCDARVNGEKPNRDFYARLRIWDRKNRRHIDAAKQVWKV